MSQTIKDKLELIEMELRRGQRDLARSLLAEISTNLSRSQAATVANLARRAGMPKKALRILSPLIHPKVKTENAATEAEMVAYAVLLLTLGATREANDLLDECVSREAEWHLAKGFASITVWDYRQALLHLTEFEKREPSDTYQYWLGRVNYAAALAAVGQTASGQEALKEIIEVTKTRGWSVLHKNALELTAQCLIQEARWTEARAALDQAEKSAAPSMRLERFLAEKWRAIASLREHGPTKDALGEIHKVREVARNIGHFESVRDCDFHEGLVAQNEFLLLKVYFGTPFTSFRERIRRESQSWLAIPESIELNKAELPSARVFDVEKGLEINGSAKLDAGKAQHRALKLFASDLYRPFTIASLHAELFPGEYFNPLSGPRRVAFVIHRLRDWFNSSLLPLEIVWFHGRYQMKEVGPIRLLLKNPDAMKTLSEPRISPKDHKILSNLYRLKPSEITASTLADQESISIRGARYFLSWAVEAGYLLKHGSGRSTYYTLAKELAPAPE